MKKSVLILTAIVSSICTLLSTAPFDSGLAAVVSVTLLVLIALHANTTRLAVIESSKCGLQLSLSLLLRFRCGYGYTDGLETSLVQDGSPLVYICRYGLHSLCIVLEESNETGVFQKYQL